MVVTVIDVKSGKFIPVQIELSDIELNFTETAQTAHTFLTMAQEESETPIVAVEVRESETRGVYIKYLAEKPNKHNVRRKPFEEVWREIINTTYEYVVPNTFETQSENFLKE